MDCHILRTLPDWAWCDDTALDIFLGVYGLDIMDLYLEILDLLYALGELGDWANPNRILN
jgi:hypothetical protein